MDGDLQVFKFNNKLDKFVSRCRGPLADTVDNLVALWDQHNLIYAFPPLKHPSLSALQVWDRGHFGDPYRSGVTQVHVVI